MEDQFVELNFPLAGLDNRWGFNDQRPRQLAEDVWARTTPVGVNVRSFDPIAQRARGGRRPGLSKYIAQAVGNIPDWIIQELNIVVLGGGDAVQASLSGREIILIGVSQGNVYTANPGDATWHTPINNTGDTPPLVFTGIVHSAANIRKMWFADGSNWVYYDPLLDEVRRWSIETYADGDPGGGEVGTPKGTLPVDSENNTPRLICTWRGRTVLSGLIGDPQNWFMSRIGNPRDFDYDPVNISPDQAVAGNFAPQGLIGDAVTSLCPYSDDILLIFCDHTIYMMAGDPMAGGQIDLVSDSIGGTWGVCWCRAPDGTIIFMSNKAGIFSLVPGQAPQRISQPIEQLIEAIDTGSNVIRLFWDDAWQGVHVFITPAASAAAATHYFYEHRTGSWWQEVFANNNHNPVCGVVFDGNLPGDRQLLLGGWDGYVYKFDATAVLDDTTPIDSEVLIGPLLTKDFDAITLHEIQAILADGSGTVNYEVLGGATAEAALSRAALESGSWSVNADGGRNLTNLIRRTEHAFYVRVFGNPRWAIEQIKGRVSTRGKVQRRGA